MPASLGKRKRTSATNSTSSKLSKVPKTTPIIPELVSEPQSEEEASDSSPEDDEDEEEDDTEVLDPQEIFRRHFEAQFKPLPPTTKKPKINPIVEDPEDEDEDWDGLSDNSAEDDEQEENGVQVVEHVKKIDSRIAGMSKGELRAFMVCTFIIFSVPSFIYPPKRSNTPHLVLQNSQITPYSLSLQDCRIASRFRRRPWRNRSTQSQKRSRAPTTPR